MRLSCRPRKMRNLYVSVAQQKQMYLRRTHIEEIGKRAVLSDFTPQLPPGEKESYGIEYLVAGCKQITVLLQSHIYPKQNTGTDARDAYQCRTGEMKEGLQYSFLKMKYGDKI